MRLFFFLAITIFSPFFAQPSAAEAFFYEWEGNSSSPHASTTGAAACNRILEDEYPESFAESQFDEVLFDQENHYWCMGGDPLILSGFYYELGVYKTCSSGGSGEACVPPTTCPTEVGNPTNLLTDSKRQDADDWTSAKEPRFGLRRTYVSDDSFTALSSSSSNSGFASVWRLEIDSAVESAGQSLIRIGTNGSRHYFNSGSLVAENGQTSLRMSLSSDPAGPTFVATDTANAKFIYSAIFGTSDYKLTRRVWKDGYAITLVRDSQDGRILSMHDNRGQAAEFTWSTPWVGSGFSSVNNLVIRSARIDTNYDGIAFVPEVLIEYTFSSNAFTLAGRGYPSVPLLTEVRRTDLATSTPAYTIAKYTYGSSGSTFPPPLATLSDGRLNSAGQEFSYASFGYADKPQATSMTTTSGHFGGADSFTFA